MFKKLLSITVAMIMIFSCMSVVVSAQSDVVMDAEPNDDLDMAQVIDSNVTVSGTLAEPDFESDEPYVDLDVFQFTITERSKIFFTLTSSSRTVIPIIGSDDEDEEGYVPEIDEDAEDLPEEMVIEAFLEKGTYYIVLLDLFAETETTYDFTMTCKSAVQTLKKEDGVWKYYLGDEFCDETTLVKYKGEWFYIENGVWNREADTLVKYEDEWFYVKNGKWTKEPTTLVKYKGEWFFIKNGKWARYTETLVKYKGEWFYIKNGKWARDAETLVKYEGQTFYVKNGKWNKNVNKTVVLGGKTYKIKNGKVA